MEASLSLAEEIANVVTVDGNVVYEKETYLGELPSWSLTQ